MLASRRSTSTRTRSICHTSAAVEKKRKEEYTLQRDTVAAALLRGKKKEDENKGERETRAKRIRPRADR